MRAAFLTPILPGDMKEGESKKDTLILIRHYGMCYTTKCHTFQSFLYRGRTDQFYHFNKFGGSEPNTKMHGVGGPFTQPKIANRFFFEFNSTQGLKNHLTPNAVTAERFNMG